MWKVSLAFPNHGVASLTRLSRSYHQLGLPCTSRRVLLGTMLTSLAETMSGLDDKGRYTRRQEEKEERKARGPEGQEAGSDAEECAAGYELHVVANVLFH